MYREMWNQKYGDPDRQRKNGVRKRTPSVADVLERWGAECAYCGLALTVETATRDHVRPVALGGTESLGNVVPACLRCNGIKGDRPLGEFKVYYAKRLWIIYRTLMGNGTYVDAEMLRDLAEERGIPLGWLAAELLCRRFERVGSCV